MTIVNFNGRVSACSTVLMGQSIKLLFYIIAGLLIVSTLHAHICNAQICHYNVNYTRGSKFESNLNRVLNSLVQHTSQTGFNTSQYGQSPDKAYGLLQCEGDKTVDQCYNCSQKINTTLRQACGTAGGGLIWLDECFLRYENYNFIGQLNTVDGYYLYNVNNVSSPDVFNRALNSLLIKLSAEAASGSKLFASGATTDSLSRKIYGLVQCWRDLSSDDCTTCLSNTVNYILTTFFGRPGAQGRMGSCIVYYEVYSFFPLTPPPAEAPVPANTAVADTRRNQTGYSSNSTQKNKSSTKIPIILGVSGGLLLVLLICLFTTGRRLKSVIFRRQTEGHGQVEEDGLIGEDPQIVFTMEALLAATENFHDNNKLGEGGFGAVYCWR